MTDNSPQDMMLAERLRDHALYTGNAPTTRRLLNEAADLIERLSRTPAADERNVYRLQSSGERLCEALRQIAGGFVPNASTLAVEGRWQEMVNELQKVAKAALNHKEPEPDWTAPKPATADDVERGIGEVGSLKRLLWVAGCAERDLDAFAEHELPDGAAGTMRDGAEAIRRLVAAMPPADEAIVGRLREALETSAKGFDKHARLWKEANARSAAIEDELRAENAEALAKAARAAASLPDTSATEKGE